MHVSQIEKVHASNCVQLKGEIMHRPILLGYNNNNIYSTRTVRAYNTKTTLSKHADSISIYSIIHVCMDVFILFVGDHRITLDEIYMEFS